MKIIEIFGEERDAEYKYLREGCRGILLQKGNILLSYEENENQYLIPGGGIEEGESLVDCCKRELAEETGTLVDPHTHYLTLEEFYHEFYFKSHYFICSFVGECMQALTEEEKKRGLIPVWVDFNEALNIFGSYDSFKETNEMRYGAYYREFLALKEVQPYL